MLTDETQHPSAEDTIIQASVEQARVSGKIIDDRAARIIASQWHDGQDGLLYRLSSTGSIANVGLMLDAIDHVRKGCTAADHRVLDALAAYVMARGTRAPQPGWTQLTW